MGGIDGDGVGWELKLGCGERAGWGWRGTVTDLGRAEMEFMEIQQWCLGLSSIP